MSRRKQSNPKSLKSDMDCDSIIDGSESGKSATEDLEIMDNNSPCPSTENDEAHSGDECASEKEDSIASDQSESRDKTGIVKSSTNSPVASSSMATHDKKDSSAVSFSDLPKAIASSSTASYLAAALRASQGPTSSTPSPPVEVKRENSLSPTKLAEAFSSTSLFNHSSLSEAALSAATLSAMLKTSSVDPNLLASMIQGIPFLSSILQRLAPGGNFVASSSSTGGILCVCGVKFNNTSNLEAHRMFYCSHRQGSSASRPERKEDSRSPSSRDQPEDEPVTSSRTLKCPHCPYTTTHKLSLNGHMNIHTNPEENNSSSNGPTFTSASADPKAQERYCSECDIQFSSMKTFRVHKLHYCQTRHVLKGSKSPIREDHSHMNIPNMSSVASGSLNSQPILALHTNPVLLLPYSLVAGAQLLPPQILPQLGAAFVMPNGQLHPIPSASNHSIGSSASSGISPLLSPGAIAAATAAVLAGNNVVTSTPSNISPPIKTESYASSRSPPQDTLADEQISSSSKRRNDGEIPLDLTTKRPKLVIKNDLLNDEEKENRELNSSISSSILKSPSAKSPFAGGEFEGKLLSSPPRLSPMTDDDHSPRNKTPRPNSTLSSHPESPRPSTSAMSSSRSPSHTSPIHSGLPSLPVGYSNPLVSNLDQISSSLPLASLQALHSLQGVPRELALKLINPDLLINSIPPTPPINTPVLVKKGEAKCDECNIVFYTKINFDVHKKHYCQSRDSKKSSDDERTSPATCSPPNRSETASSPLRSPIADTSSAPTASKTPMDNTTQLKPVLSFICTACGIRFSSPDNLNAHQTYYCPKRENVNEEATSAKGAWRCPRCRIVMAETMQAAHQCVSPAPAPSHGWKCPCCPVLSPTAAAAQKHLETHAGIKAFRCTICGYRGNTLRGMRTHIRMHFEKRTNDLQEENFIACILEDDEPRGSRNSSSNEARKLLDSTRMLLESSALSSLFVTENMLSEQGETPFSCSFCSFATSVRTTLLQHMTLVHNVGLESKLSLEIKSILEAKNAAAAQASSSSINNSESKLTNHSKEVENGTREPTPPLIKMEPEVKLEITENLTEDHAPLSPKEEENNKISPPPRASPTPATSNGVCYCQTCNISFNMFDSYVAHKRFYCTRPESSTPPETTVQ